MSIDITFAEKVVRIITQGHPEFHDIDKSVDLKRNDAGDPEALVAWACNGFQRGKDCINDRDHETGVTAIFIHYYAWICIGGKILE